MSDKLFVRRRILAFLMVFLLVFSAIILLPAFSVDAETEEEYVVASSGEISNEVALASGLSNIPTQYLNKCIELTDSDEFEYKGTKYSIKDYPNIYKNMYTAAGREPYKKLLGVVSIANSDYDDPISKIVPVELMKQIGVYEYFGKEYGFFIKTFKSESLGDDTIHSIVFVFDIKYSMKRGQDGNPDGCVAVNIEPVFQYAYVYLDSNDKSFTMYDYETPTHSFHVNYSISSNVIIPHPKNNGTSWSYDYWDIFYLKDISVGMSLFNEQALNYQKDRYLWDEVDGAFFTMTDSEYMGHVLKERKLTTDDKLDIASFVASYVFDMIGLGANLIVPGSGTLIEMIDLTNLTIGWTGDIYKLDKIQTGEQLGFKEKNVTFTSLYANKTEQKKHYNGLVKSMLVANNSDNNNSIWYGQGDHYRAIFGINAEIGSGKQFPNTRAFVECALKIVDKKGNVYGAQNAVSKTVDNKVYQDEAKLGIKKDLYFLENGYNYFAFLPNFSGNYKFNINLENEVELKVDGATSADNTFYIEKRDAANPVKVQIDNIGNFARGELFIDALPMSKSFELSAGTENIVRADVASSGYYNISIKNSNNVASNAIFMSKFIPNDSFGVYEDLSRTNKEMTYLDSCAYLVVMNPSRNTETLYIDYKDVEDINEAESVDCKLISKVPQYIKFVTDDNMDYNISYLNSSFVSVSVYDVRGNEIAKTTVSGEKYNDTIFNSADLGEVYIKLVYLGNDKIDFNFTVYNIRSEIRWFIDDKEVPSRRIELERGKTVKISAKINDAEIFGISSNHNNGSEITFIGDSYIFIDKTAPLGKITYGFKLRNDDRFPLTVVPIFEKTISLSLDSAWNLNYSGGNRIEGFEYYVKIVDYEEERVSSNMSSGKCDFRNQLLSTHNFNPKINIKSIIEGLITNVPINGWQDSYVDVYVYITNIQVVLDDDGSFDTFGTSYESKSYCMRYYDFFAGGNGTQNNPYKISNIMEFYSLKMLNRDIIDDSYFKQTANLSFGNVLPHTSNMSFRGIYDGGGYTITYSYVFPAANFKSYIGGMFLDNYGTISNLTVNATINNFSVWNKDDMYGLGGIVGTNYGTISKVNANVNISSCFYFTGGITAVNEGTIENCKVTGKIDLKCEGDFIIGGMIAGSTFGKISSCSSASSTISYVGAESKSRTLSPRMGTIVGIWGGGTLLPTGYGTVNKGTLKTVTWWEGLKKKSHNQAQYVGNIYGQKTF